MSGKNKNHNRIIFLTTLSVYLGLVLVGATPAVLAQAQPIVRKENKSVNSKGQQAEYKEQLLIDFKNKVAELVQSGKLDLSKPFDSTLVFSVEGDAVLNPRVELISGEPLIADLHKQLFDAASESGLFLYFSRLNPEEVSFRVNNDGKVLNANIALKIEKSEDVRQVHFAMDMFVKIAKMQSERLSIQGKLLAENTTVSSENNQVFIVTRLPRAAIDEFLATNAR